MRKLLLIVGALAAMALAGCAHHRGSYKKVPELEERRHVPVTVKDGAIVVPDPLVFLKGEQNVIVSWNLPAESGLRFPDNGIVIEGALTDKVLRRATGDAKADAVLLDGQQKEVVDCKRIKDGLAFTCLNRNTKSGIYKYTIRVRQGDKLLERDPGLVNGDW